MPFRYYVILSSYIEIRRVLQNVRFEAVLKIQKRALDVAVWKDGTPNGVTVARQGVKVWETRCTIRLYVNQILWNPLESANTVGQREHGDAEAGTHYSFADVCVYIYFCIIYISIKQ